MLKLNKILICLPFLFIQSCAGADKVALKCKEHSSYFILGKYYKFNADRYYLINYNKNEISGFTKNEIYKFNDLMISPEKITFTIPIDGVPKNYSIDRTSLDISAEKTTPHSIEKVIGKCSKTSPPNLSSYGKQI